MSSAPTKPGFYWARFSTGVWEPVKVMAYGGKLTALLLVSEDDDELDRCDYVCAWGPRIEPPSLPSTPCGPRNVDADGREVE